MQHGFESIRECWISEIGGDPRQNMHTLILDEQV